MNKLNLFFVVLFSIVSLSSFKRSFLDKSYCIDEQSTLLIEGSTNVNNFTCECTQEFTNSTVSFETGDGGSTLHFEHAELKLLTKLFNCGNRAINKDLQKALKADKHPSIEIALEHIKHKSGLLVSSCQQWVPLQALSKITIAGVSRTTPLEIEGRRLSESRFQFRCIKSIYMTDFGITPPKAVLGLIEVNDQICINIDLVINLQ